MTLGCVRLQMDYRSLVHEKDEAAYCEIRVILLDIRGYYVCIPFDYFNTLTHDMKSSLSMSVSF